MSLFVVGARVPAWRAGRVLRVTPRDPLAVGVAGAAGRLGREIAAMLDRPGTRCAGGLVRPGAPTDERRALFDDPDRLVARVDVLIDVSRAEAVARHAGSAARAGIGLVVGVTGLDTAATDALQRAAGAIPVVVAANFAVGAAVLRDLARRLAAALPADEFDAEILETHHRDKRDAPSGTALAIGRAVAAGRGQRFDAVAVRGRDGVTGPRPPGAIGFASSRAGAIVGEHALSFTAAGEQIAVTHRAFDRRVFADGAVRAAVWIAGRPPGRYGMEDVLGLA